MYATPWQKIWLCCIRNNFWIPAVHIQGVQHSEAGSCSRNLFENIKYKLNIFLGEGGLI